MKCSVDLTENQWKYIKKTVNLKDREEKASIDIDLEDINISDEKEISITLPPKNFLK